MTFLRDETLAHLRSIAELPDFSATRYRIVREIGRGGMGVVYEAEDLELERRVAIKVLATDLVSPEAAERMKREARIMARLEHPAIVPLHDVGELPDGRVFYAMKLVRGERLDVFTRGGHGRAERLRVFLRVCEAVAFAHAQGIVHRDLKPENIMAGEFGAVLVMDWGVAATLDDAQRGVRIGTPGYMAPEQERGEPAGATSDVYALGGVLRFLCGDGPLPRPLAAVIAKARSPEPGARYASAAELAEDISAYLDGAPLRAYRENVAERLARWVSRNRALVTIVVAYLVMRAIVFLWVGR